jgi:hypothetical protein
MGWSLAALATPHRDQKVETYPHRGGTFGEAVIMHDFLTCSFQWASSCSYLPIFFD